ncbi:MAG: hypothetical protein KME05_20875 [Gloeocapsa sp. UFS-A4-WI-NPMV-4B04]|jgi:hypothetical protein|nr:hypothetical protein [Gloeocapsa sp. UFS-A4-WI-NPMV-4B04]
MKVKLVNAHHVKTLPGRKTDVLDCQWLQQLHSYGLLSGSFRPENEICVLRSYIRQRDNLIRTASVHIQWMQKALTQMNIQLHQVRARYYWHYGYGNHTCYCRAVNMIHGKSNSALGAFYRRLRSRLGSPKAITATAHKIARLFYKLWTTGGDYTDPGMDYYEQRYRERMVNNLQKKAQAFGFELIPQLPGNLVS